MDTVSGESDAIKLLKNRLRLGFSNQLVSVRNTWRIDILASLLH